LGGSVLNFIAGIKKFINGNLNQPLDELYKDKMVVAKLDTPCCLIAHNQTVQKSVVKNEWFSICSIAPKLQGTANIVLMIDMSYYGGVVEVAFDGVVRDVEAHDGKVVFENVVLDGSPIEITMRLRTTTDVSEIEYTIKELRLDGVLCEKFVAEGELL
jgi:hypothetical protein